VRHKETAKLPCSSNWLRNFGIWLYQRRGIWGDLVCNAVLFGMSPQTFRRNIRPPISRSYFVVIRLCYVASNDSHKIIPNENTIVEVGIGKDVDKTPGIDLSLRNPKERESINVVWNILHFKAEEIFLLYIFPGSVRSYFLYKYVDGK
jgi:hypothetical protein